MKTESKDESKKKRKRNIYNFLLNIKNLNSYMTFSIQIWFNKFFFNNKKNFDKNLYYFYIY